MERPIESKTSVSAPKDLQKMKLIFDLIKWFIVSVVLVVITMVIDYGFRDRQAGLNEAKQYDHYVTELIVLNKEVGPRRLLAQYFSFVLPSEKLKKGWREYYWVVNEEYKALVKRDSVLNSKIKWFMTRKAISEPEQVEFEALSKEKQYTEKELRGELRLPPCK